jgi:hypothetical protein
MALAFEELQEFLADFVAAWFVLAVARHFNLIPNAQ